MSLNWEWSDKMGEAIYEDGTKSDIFKGNAFMIGINRWEEEDGSKMYSLAWFFAEEAHVKNCFGLTKGYEKESFNSNFNIKEFKLNTNYKETAKFVQLLAKGKAKVKIELY